MGQAIIRTSDNTVHSLVDASLGLNELTEKLGNYYISRYHMLQHNHMNWITCSEKLINTNYTYDYIQGHQVKVAEMIMAMRPANVTL